MKREEWNRRWGDLMIRHRDLENEFENLLEIEWEDEPKPNKVVGK